VSEVASDAPEQGPQPARHFLQYQPITFAEALHSLCRSLLAVLLIAAAAYVGATLYYGVRLSLTLHRLKAAGKPVTEADVALPPVSEQQNAARLYFQAAEIVKDHAVTTSFPRDADGDGIAEPDQKQPGQASRYTNVNWSSPQDLAMLSDYVREDEQALALIKEAVKRPQCRLDVLTPKGG